MRIFLFLTLVISLESGCAAHRLEVIPPNVTIAPLAYLEDDHSLKDDVLQRLGDPSGQYEEGTVITYELDKHYRRVSTKAAAWDRVRYSLVLVFDSNNVLQEHRIIRVR